MLTRRRVETEQSMQQSRWAGRKPFAVKQPYYPSSELLIRERHALASS
jgi:hypothetical protein